MISRLEVCDIPYVWKDANQFKQSTRICNSGGPQVKIWLELIECWNFWTAADIYIGSLVQF